jgi:hypothetical protein
MMKRPALAIFKIYSGRLTKGSLEAAYENLRHGIRAASRCTSMRGVTMAIGKIEAVPVNLGGKMVWLVHAHVLLDIDGELSVKAIRSDFRRVTGRRNSFFDVQGIRSGTAITAYITKARDVAPEPGRFTLDQFEQLIGAFKGKELLVSWGVGLRGKSAKAKPESKHHVWRLRWADLRSRGTCPPISRTQSDDDPYP